MLSSFILAVCAYSARTLLAPISSPLSANFFSCSFSLSRSWLSSWMFRFGELRFCCFDELDCRFLYATDGHLSFELLSSVPGF